jgi:hypothetical protein
MDGFSVDPRTVAGDPFVAASPCACNDGWVSVGQIVVDDDGEEYEEYALYICSTCAGRSS